MKTRQLLLILSKRFPKRIAKKYCDYVGLMCGKLPLETHKILLCLDYDEEVFEVAKKEKPDLIISHHPFIYGTKAKVFKYDLKRKELYEKTENAGLTVYSMHTNFDEGKGGMNDALAAALELENITPLNNDLMARTGTLKTPMSIDDFALYAKEKLHVSYAHLLPYGKKIIKSVAIIGGGGSRNYRTAQEQGIDIYISGDAPHHVRRSIVNDHYNYLDVPHEVERIFMPTLKNIILQLDQTMDIVIVDHEIEPKTIL